MACGQTRGSAQTAPPVQLQQPTRHGSTFHSTSSLPNASRKQCFSDRARLERRVQLATSGFGRRRPIPSACRPPCARANAAALPADKNATSARVMPQVLVYGPRRFHQQTNCGRNCARFACGHGDHGWLSWYCKVHPAGAGAGASRASAWVVYMIGQACCEGLPLGAAWPSTCAAGGPPCPAPAPASAPACPLLRRLLPSLRPSSPLPRCTPPGGPRRRRALWRVSVCYGGRLGGLVGVTVRGCVSSDLSRPCPSRLGMFVLLSCPL